MALYTNNEGVTIHSSEDVRMHVTSLSQMSIHVHCKSWKTYSRIARKFERFGFEERLVDEDKPFLMLSVEFDTHDFHLYSPNAKTKKTLRESFNEAVERVI